MKVWPFGRKQREESTLPKEVEDYKASVRKQRVGIAWLLALATIAVTVVLTLVLYFAGRWVWQRFTQSEPTEVPTTQTQPQTVDQTTDSSEQATSDAADSGQAPTTAQPNPEPAQLPGSDEPVQNTPSGARVPDTGPGDGIALFVVVSLLGMLIHNRISVAKE